MKMTKDQFNHMTASSHISKKDIIVGNFLGGLFWGLGTVIGATIFFGSLYWSLKWIDWVPVIGQFARQTTGTIDEPPARFKK